MTLLSLDPSSSIVGYAVMRGAGQLVEAGRLKPSKTRLDAVARIVEFGDELLGMLEEFNPEHVVIEIPSGHMHARMRGKASALAIYGMSVGYVISIVHVSGFKYSCIDCNEWTRGKKKEDRAEMVALRYPQYRMDADSGMDAADAIGLGDWWYARNYNGKLCKS